MLLLTGMLDVLSLSFSRFECWKKKYVMVAHHF
jgi:hypothetical protein